MDFVLLIYHADKVNLKEHLCIFKPWENNIVTLYQNHVPTLLYIYDQMHEVYVYTNISIDACSGLSLYISIYIYREKNTIPVPPEIADP